MIFLTKFAQREFFGLKKNNMNIIIKFCTLEVIYVLNFTLNKQFWILDAMWPKRVFPYYLTAFLQEMQYRLKYGLKLVLFLRENWLKKLSDRQVVPIYAAYCTVFLSNINPKTKKNCTQKSFLFFQKKLFPKNFCTFGIKPNLIYYFNSWLHLKNLL